jgi:ribosomal protein S18 acetylase RimI-like enzyme
MEVVPANPHNVGMYSDLFARTFSDDPILTWPLLEEGVEQSVKRNWMTFGPACVDAGWIWEVPVLQGFASWIPPNEGSLFIEIEARSRTEVAAITPDGGERYHQLWDWIEAHLPDEPHWYLDHIAVAPQRQGEGVGSALIRFGLERASADGVPAFLETARERNVALYEHLGFRTVSFGSLPGGGPMIWFMRWDPPDANRDLTA